MSISTDFYRTAILLLSERWPDVHDAWGGGPCRATVWKVFRDLEDAHLAAAVEEVLDTAPDTATPFELARLVVGVARRLVPDRCQDPVSIFRRMLEEKARDYPPWDNRPVPANAIPHPDPAKRAEGWKYVPRKEDETNE